MTEILQEESMSTPNYSKPGAPLRQNRQVHGMLFNPQLLGLLMLLLLMLGFSTAFAAETTGFCNFSTSKQNLWTAGEAATIEKNLTLFEVPLSVDTKELTGDFRPVVNILGDDYGADIGAAVDAKIGMYFNLNATAGEVDVDYGGAVRFTYPDPRSFVKGATFTIKTALDEKLKHIVTRSPRVVTDLYLAGYISLDAYFKFLLQGNEYPVFNLNFDSRDFASSDPQINPYYTINGVNGNMGFSLFSLDSGTSTTPGNVKIFYPQSNNLVNGGYIKHELPFPLPDEVTEKTNISGTLNLPHLELDDDFENDKTNPSLLKASGEDLFIELVMDLDAWLPIPPQFEFLIRGEYKKDFMGVGYGASYDIFNVELGFNVSEVQEFEFTPVISTTLTFSSPLRVCVKDSWVTTPPAQTDLCWLSNRSSITMKVGQNLHVVYPTGTGAPDSITATPSFAITQTNFKNTTKLHFEEPLTFELLKAEAHIDGFELVPEICIPEVSFEVCYIWDCSTVVLIPRICTPRIGFDGLKYELGPVWDYTMSSDLQNQYLTVYTNNWSLGGFGPASVTDNASIFNMIAGNPPTVYDASLAVTEDQAKSSTFSATAILNNSQTFRVISQGQKGTVTIANPATNSFIYTPNANAYGSDTFTFKVHDNNPLIDTDSNLGTITVNITNINDTPADILLSKDYVAQASAVGTMVGSLAVVDVDLPDHDSHTFTLTDSAGGRFKIVGTELQVANGTLLNYASATQHTVTVKVTDASNATYTKSFVIKVKSIPVANNGTLPVTEDYLKTGTLVATDQDGETPTYSIVSNPSKGTVVITNAATGAYTYAPTPNAIGTDTFTFRSTDTSGYQSNVATITVTISSVNDPIRDITITPAISDRDHFDFVPVPFNDNYPNMVSSGDYVILCTSGLTYQPIEIHKRQADGSFVRQTIERPAEGWAYGTGKSCSISGDYAAVGTDRAIFLLKRNATDGAWRRETILNGPANTNIGGSLVFNGDTIITSNAGASRGVYIYTRNSTSGAWDQPPQGVGQYTLYDTTIALSGNRAVVGTSVSTYYNRATYLIEKDGNGAWNLSSPLKFPAGYNITGNSVALSGDTIVIGDMYHFSYDQPGNSGAAYVLSRQTDGSWKSTTIYPSDGQDWDNFGRSVAISGNTIAVGAPLKDTVARKDAGAVYVFTRDSSEQFTQTKQILPPASDKVTLNFGYMVNLMENSDDILSANYYYQQPSGYTGGYNKHFYYRTNIAPSLLVNEGLNHGTPQETALGGSISGDAVGTIAPVDPDLDNPDAIGTYTFTLTDNAGGRFKIVGTALQIDNASLLDYEGAKVHSIKVRAVDNNSNSLEKTFRVYLNNLNEAPKANSTTFTTLEDTTLTGTLTGSDSNNSTLTFKIDSVPAKGMLTLNAATGAFTYIPFPNLNGDDTFSFKTNDGLHDSIAATVTIHITPTNDQPIDMSSLATTVKLTDPSGAAGDLYGISVALSGNYALIGARNNNENATASGAAYFLQKNDDGLWQQTLKVKPGSQTNEYTGTSVAISDSYAIVGAYGYDKSGAADSGIAYLYKLNNGVWNYDTSFDPTQSQAGDYTGISVGISGSYAIAGAPGASINGAKSGAAYIMEHGASAWNAPVRLIPTDGATGDLFGSATAISGNYAIVGSPADADKGNYSGSAYIFERNSTSGIWEQKAKLLATDGAAGDSFGSSVAISGNDAVVGAPFRTNTGMTKSGAAYVFKRDNNGNWTQVAKLISADAAPGSEFGVSVSLSGDILAIGSHKDGNQGSVQVFRRATDGIWKQFQKISAADGATGDRFGSAVAQSGATTLVGAPLADISAKADAGKAYLFSSPSVPENSPVDTVVGALSVLDIDGSDTFTYTMLDNAGGRFKLNGNQILVANGTLLNYEAKTSHDIRVRATDSGGASTEKIITIIITDVNEAPVALNDNLFTNKDVQKEWTLHSTDPENRALTYSIVTNGTMGTVEILDAAAGTYRYTPNPGVTGTDTFTFKASDGVFDSNTATITVYIANDINEGLLAFYSFNGDANDSSGNNRHGTVNGPTLTVDRFGNANSAYQFNWNSISMPSFSIGGSFSFTAWVRNDYYVSPLQYSWSGANQKLLELSGGTFTNVIVGLNGNSDLTLTVANELMPSSANVPRYNWTHIAVTFSNSNVNFYVNGELKSTKTFDTAIAYFSRPTQLIGPALVGAMDEVRLYNRVLTPIDIRYISAVPSCGSVNHSILTSAPTTNLCSEGEASAVTGSGPWNWTCNGPTSSASCTAYRPVIGSCSAANGMSLDVAPTNLCASGTPSTVAGSGPWTWTCNGAYTGATASCSANINTYPLSVVKTGNGTGLVTASPSSLTWSSNTGMATYNAGTEVTLTAVPGENNTFAGWSGACSGTAPCTVTMSAAKNVAAAFVNKNDGLIAYYPFNGSADDASGNGRHATVSGSSLTGDVSGIPDYAYNFNGTGNYISIPSFPIGGEFSVSAWVYLNNNSSNWQRLIDFGNGQWNNNLIIGWVNQKMFVEGYNGSTSQKVYSTENFPQGQWVHVAAAIDAVGNTTIYWNGEVKGTGRTIVPPLLSRSNQFLGKSNWPDPYFGGKIDEVRLYSRALADSDVKALYQVSGTCGSTHEANVTSVPTTGLCQEGTASAVTGSGPWAWTCSGDHGGGNASCSANLKVNGACGTSNGQVLTTITGANLCSSGNASPVTGAGPWNWSCQGINTGSDTSCSAAIQTYQVTITKSGTGTGTITDNTGGLISWNGAIGTGTIKHGTNLVLNAVLDPGSVVKSWMGIANDSESYSVTVDSAKNIAVEFSTALLSDGLLINWLFDGNANDTSGNGFNGIVRSATLTADRFGSSNKAYSFPGSLSNITIAPTAALPTVNNLSVSLWFKTDSGIEYSYDYAPHLISKRKWMDPFNRIYAQAQFAVSMPAAGQYDIESGGQLLRVNGSFTNNEWTHLAVVYRGTTATVYENGVQIGQGTVGAVHDLGNYYGSDKSDLFVGMGGQDPWQNPRWDRFKGSIDEVRIYNRALTATEVGQLRMFNTSTLTLTKSTTGSGSVTSNTGTIKWNGATGTANYDITNNTVVTLTAVADTGSVFTGWSGACSGVGTCTVTMDASRDVSATFMYPTDGMVAYYPFNGNANDSGSNGYNGTDYGATATTDRFGNANSALSFDGTSNYISLPSFTIGGPFSVAAWVYLDNNAINWQRLIDFGNGQYNNNLVLGWVSQHMFFECYNGASTLKIETTETFPQGQWVHVTATIDGNGNAKIYWNGVLKASGTTYVPPSVSRTNQYIGKSNWPDPYFMGKMDDLRLYNRALAEPEAFAMSTRPLTVTRSGSGTGTVASNKGTLQWNGLIGTTTFLSGEVVTLTATPDSSATFTGWTGACSGTGSCVVTMDGIKNVGAVFTHDTIPPTGTITIDSGATLTNTTAVNLSLSCVDTDTGCALMQFSNDNVTWSTPESYASSKAWPLNPPKIVPLTISNFLPNYQTQVTVQYDSDMRTDFGDLRFFDTTTGASIPYWFEGVAGGVSATVWIKTGANNTIAMGYGNFADTYIGNPESVFELYDDFNTAIDSNKWVVGNPGNGVVGTANGHLYVGTNSGTDYWGTADTSIYLVSKNPQQGDYVAETYISNWESATYARTFSLRSGLAATEKTFFLLHNGAPTPRITNGYRDAVGAGANWYGEDSGITYTTGSGGNGENRIAKFVVTGDTVSSYWDNQLVNTRTVSGWGLGHIAFTDSYNAYLGEYNFYEWVRVRKYNATDPTVSIGAEQPWTAYNGNLQRTVYVKYMDNAGNWSSTYNDTIQLDTAGPTSTASPAGGVYNAAQNVTLTCNDGTGSGCNGIYYTTDGSIPTNGSTSYTDPISISSHTVLKFFASDTAGNNGSVSTEVYSFDLLGGAVQKGEITVEPAVVTTLAGLAGAAGTIDASGTAARFNGPAGITTDGANLYTTGYGDHTVRKIVIATGQVSTVAGQANSPGSGDGTGTSAQFNNPWGITTDGANLYVADTANHTIRKIVIDTGAVTTLAGLAGNTGSSDGNGSAARFSQPRGVTSDGVNLYVADSGNHTLRKIVIASGAVSTIAGTAGSSGAIDDTGSAALFNGPSGIATDGTNLYVSDNGSQIIRKVVMSTNAVTTLAGTAGAAGSVDGTAAAARFYYPVGIVTDGTNLYVADQWSQAIRKIDIATGSVLTIAGALGSAGSADGSGWDARFNNPCTITSDGTSLYVADYGNHTIRKISTGSDTRGNGLIAHYPFNGNANDISGSNYNGTVSGATLTTDRFGNADSAYNFNGIDNYISLPSFTIGGAFSLSTWLNRNDSSTSWQRIIDFGNGQANNNLIVGLVNQKLFVDVFWGGASFHIETSEDVPQGQWTHVAATIGADGWVQLYLNGVLKGSGWGYDIPYLSRTYQYIGKSNWAGDSFLSTRMDDLRLYNRVLSLPDIEALYTYENGSCGTANSQTFATSPTTNLCSKGIASVVSVNGGSLNWTCNGVNGGADAQCGGNIIVNGSCGSSSGQSFDTAPDANLCQYGAPSTVTGSGPWQWTCAGYFGGTSADCSADIKNYLLTVDKSGSGNSAGTVNVNSGILNWSSNTGTATYNSGDTVTLTATANATGTYFTGWSGACAGTGSCMVTMDAAKNVTARFTDLTTGLMAYYPLHSDANDVSGNGRHAVVTGATLVSNSQNDGIPAYKFNDISFTGYGVTFTNDPKYLTVPPFEFGGAFSVTAWLSLPLYTCNNQYIACGWDQERIIDFGTGQSDNIIVSIVRGKLHAEVRDGTNNGVGITSAEFFPDMERTHVAVTINGSGFMKMYWNGVLKASGQAAVPRTVTRADQYVGKSNWAVDPYTLGMMDDIRLYNRALTDSDIADLASSRDAICGSASGQRMSTKPDADLCLRGIASAVTGEGPWSWTCAGITTGNDATCSAAHAAEQAITFNPVNTVFGAAQLDLSTYATGGTSGNPVTFSLVSGPGTLGGINNSLLTLTGTGNIVVKASQAGNTDYFDAPAVQQTITVAKAAATVTLGGLSQAYDGSAKPVTVTTIPANRNVIVTYNGSATVPTVVGSYAVVATIDDANYQGTASGNLVIGNGNVAITLDGLETIYDGTPKTVTAITNPTGKTVTFTYNGSSTPPTDAGSYAVVATVVDSSYQGTATGTLVISRKPAAVTLGNLSQTYDGSARAVSVTTNPAGKTVTVTYNGSSTAPTTAGSYSVVATVVDSNYQGTASGILVIDKAVATVTLGNLSATYDGTPKSATYTVAPAGKTVVVTYNDRLSSPTDAGIYSVVASVDDTNYAGVVYGTMTIAKATTTVSLGTLNFTYDGNAKPVTATTTPAGLPVTVTYKGSTTAPVNAGSYAVTATINDTNYGGTASGTLVIAKATASISLGNLLVSYDGSQKTATAITNPAGKIVTLTYNGLSTAPTAIGSYAVVATIDDVNYQGTANGILEITAQPLILSFSATPRLNYLLADITAFTASDNTAITGYCVTEANVSSGCSWSSTAPASYTFATAGQKTLYAFVKDADGNISAPSGPVAMAVSSPSLTVNIATNGTLTSGIGGTVTSVPSGLSCTNTVKDTVVECVKGMSGTVTLYATPSILSRFGGWGGTACSGTGSCLVTMDADKSVTATFNQAALLHIGGTEYGTLQAAYDAAGTTSVIQLLATDTGTLTANRNVSVTLKGGYDASYNSTAGLTGIGKPLIIELGTIIVDGIAIK